MHFFERKKSGFAVSRLGFDEQVIKIVCFAFVIKSNKQDESVLSTYFFVCVVSGLGV